MRLIQLFGIYKNLLTEHQKDLFNLYYECDLSLGEIADIKGISRQSVNDAIKKAKDILIQSEENLGFYAKITAVDQLIGEREEKISQIDKQFLSQLKEILELN